jgi:hypothetical protein
VCALADSKVDHGGSAARATRTSAWRFPSYRPCSMSRYARLSWPGPGSSVTYFDRLSPLAV